MAWGSSCRGPTVGMCEYQWYDPSMRERLIPIISVVLWISGAIVGSGAVVTLQNPSDKRTVQQKIDDLLTLRLTREVIRIYIFDSVQFALKTYFTDGAERVMPLYRAVEKSMFGYEALWRRLDDYERFSHSPGRNSWARQVAKEAVEVNKSLGDFRVVIVALDAGTQKIMDPQLKNTLDTYGKVPASPDEFNEYFRNLSDEEVKRIVSQTIEARDTVRSAHACFLCFMATRYRLPLSKSVDCRACG